MDAKGRCFDNIHMERFFRSLKQENVYLSRYETLKEAKIGISSYINIYNTKRLHSAIGYKTPFEVYNQDYANIFDCCMKKEKILTMLTVS